MGNIKIENAKSDGRLVVVDGKVEDEDDAEKIRDGCSQVSVGYACDMNQDDLLVEKIEQVNVTLGAICSILEERESDSKFDGLFGRMKRVKRELEAQLEMFRD